MKAEIIELRGDTSVVIVKGILDHGTVITVNSLRCRIIAEGIARMLNEDQCPVCGKFNGLHGEVFTKTGQSGGGEVDGYYKICPNGPK